ncbi:rod shape-determining protein MreC [Calidifontibacter sp. DB0510]|uniref:Cell shape-determining protein MreC n=1 Tax=Metallococcus carri TaxID=1656884 RepID=A0A967AZD5_9MICO|nr:rod shape-determining protein MreC [Metallococcus carri]NHN55904.1 rod shape-determining protein MreC [Metallococcus carri]NOP38408.1 rod shape-determining protein MreC [Calidifontibacter sp. DB2511S]
MAFRASVRRRVLVGALAVSCGAIVIDQAAPSLTAPVRSAAADVAGPVQNWVTGRDGTITRLTRERDAARRQVSADAADRATLQRLTALMGSAPAQGRLFVPAQIVGYVTGTTPSSLRRLTLDVGSADGVSNNLTVIAAGGLVGRVISTSRWNCEVQLLSDPTAVVGARVSGSGTVGSVSSVAPVGLPTRAPGLLTFTVAGLGPVAVGDKLVSLGSVDNRPYVPDVPIGTIVSVDPDRGQGSRTAVVRTDVSFDRLALVGVVLPADRTSPRPAVTGR